MDRTNQICLIIASLRNAALESVSIKDNFIRVSGVDHGVIERCGNLVTFHQFDAASTTFLLA